MRNGEQTHRGLELAAEGKAIAGLSYSLSMMALDSEQSGTGNASLDGKRAHNVPKFKSAAVLEYAVPALAGLKLTGMWQYVGKKAFDVENTVTVPGYSVFNLGAMPPCSMPWASASRRWARRRSCRAKSRPAPSSMT